MKTGWQVSTRMSEADFYELTAGVEGLPEIRCSGTIVPSLREGVRGRFEQVLPSKPDGILPEDLSFKVLVMIEIKYHLFEPIGWRPQDVPRGDEVTVIRLVVGDDDLNLYRLTRQ